MRKSVVSKDIMKLKIGPGQSLVLTIAIVGDAQPVAAKPVAKKIAVKAASKPVAKKAAPKTEKAPKGGDKIAAVIALCAKNPEGLSAAVLEHKLGFKVAPIVRKAIDAGHLKKTGQTRATLYFVKAMNGQSVRA